MVCKAAEQLCSFYRKKGEEKKAVALLMDLVVRNPYQFYTRSIKTLLDQLFLSPQYSDERQAFEKWKNKYHIEGCCCFVCFGIPELLAICALWS